MNVLAISKKIAPVSGKVLGQMRVIEDCLLELPQVELQTEQFLFAGCYCRTILIPKGVVITGALIRIPTLVIVSGHLVINSGEKIYEIKGYEVLQGSANRKQVARAIEDTYMTMIFATNAKDTDEAEKEFTDEYQRLQTRRRKK